MARRALQEINAGSMADIAFLLLIFFLVTTTMDTDTGIMRTLPAMPDPNQPEPPPIRERNVFVVLLNQNNDLLVEGERTDVRQLREKTKEFILNPENLPNFPEKVVRDIPLIGPFEVSKGIISLKNDRGTSYKAYIEVQNELTAAIYELRNDLSTQRFGKKFDDISSEQQSAITEIYPVSISEAEPVSVGGN